MWAEFWQRDKVKNSKTVYSIAKRIRNQYPNFVPLTLAEELGELSKEVGNMSVSDPKLREDIIEQTGQEPGIIPPNNER